MLLVVWPFFFILSFFGVGNIKAPKTFVPQIICSLTMVPPNKPFGAESAKAYAGAQGIKRFFAVIQPKTKNLGSRPPKKRKKNVLIDADTSSAMTRAPDSPPDSPLIVDVLVTTKKKTCILGERRAS